MPGWPTGRNKTPIQDQLRQMARHMLFKFSKRRGIPKRIEWKRCHHASNLRDDRHQLIWCSRSLHLGKTCCRASLSFFKKKSGFGRSGFVIAWRLIYSPAITRDFGNHRICFYPFLTVFLGIICIWKHVDTSFSVDILQILFSKSACFLVSCMSFFSWSRL